MDEQSPQSDVANSNREPCLALAQLGHRKIIAFNALAEGRKVVVIELNDQQYRLRLTKAGRLVLTK